VAYLSLGLTRGQRSLLGADRLNDVVASFAILGRFPSQCLRAIFSNFTQLVGPQRDAHVYVPTRRRMLSGAASNLVSRHGLGFDEGLDSSLVQSLRQQGNGVVGPHQHYAAPAVSSTDPHAMQTVTNAKHMSTIFVCAHVGSSADAALFEPIREGLSGEARGP